MTDQPLAKPKRKRPSTSPTQRSLKDLRARGYTVAIVEHWNPHAHKRMDLFGFGDLLAIGNGEIVLVQTTSGTNMAARRTKMRELPGYLLWLAAGGVIELHGWRQLQVNGAKRWALRCERHRGTGDDAVIVNEFDPARNQADGNA